MRIRLAAAAAGLFFIIGATGAQAQAVAYWPALDAIGNAESPVTEAAAQIPDGVEFAPELPALPSRRGRVTIDSGAPTPLPAPPHRRIWEIPVR